MGTRVLIVIGRSSGSDLKAGATKNTATMKPMASQTVKVIAMSITLVIGRIVRRYAASGTARARASACDKRARIVRSA